MIVSSLFQSLSLGKFSQKLIPLVLLFGLIFSLNQKSFIFAQKKPPSIEHSDSKNPKSKALTPQDPVKTDFFEAKIRPVLVDQCYSCHSEKTKNPKGGLKLDSAASLNAGGDSGPVIDRKNPENSRILIALKYRDPDLQMPPKAKLSDQVIADFTKWVQEGASWPGVTNSTNSSGANSSTSSTNNARKGFNLEERRKQHWSWQPIKHTELPQVKNLSWCREPSDRYILSALEREHLTVAKQAMPEVWLRRVYFDLIGLPPTPEKIMEFLKNPNEKAKEKIVDELLASPRFGEHWARHWLDLVRYAESRGHEFDFNIPNPYQYRDYVIRALNQDVPYNQFVLEHVMGDMLQNPRVDPKTGVNESILGTGFWFLGEEVHSPVDIRADQADRIDNRIDVFSKAFLSLTVACARCHDHKFDAISAKDYYSLFSILENSNYRLVRFQGREKNREIETQRTDLQGKAQALLQKALADEMQMVLSKLKSYLFASRDYIRASQQGATEFQQQDLIKQLIKREGLDEEKLKQWIAYLKEAAKNTNDPFYPLAVAILPSVNRKLPPSTLSMPVLAQPQWKIPSERWIIDYTHLKPGEFLPDDVSFGSAPIRAGTAEISLDSTNPIANWANATSAKKVPFWNKMGISPGSQNDTGALGRYVRSGRTIRTPMFRLQDGTGADAGKISVYMRGRATIYFAVGGHVVIEGPLHGNLVRSVTTGKDFSWQTFDLNDYKGLPFHIEFTHHPDRDLEIQYVIQGLPPTGMKLATNWADELALSNKSFEELTQIYQELANDFLVHLKENHLVAQSRSEVMICLANWTIEHSNLVRFFAGTNKQNVRLRPETIMVENLASQWTQRQQKLFKEVNWNSPLAIAMQEGGSYDDRVFLRGSHKNLGITAPRQFLTALVGENKGYTRSGDGSLSHHVALMNPGESNRSLIGSGRQELAVQLLDPKINPYISRVIVNRIWHHLFGRGIVPSVDNFGVLGEKPSHPELLDFLATRFVQEGWSIKKEIKHQVLSSTYAMSSRGDEQNQQKDANNIYLHHFRIKRLQGENIRDSMLLISGTLRNEMGGKPIPIHLTEFLGGRGRPGENGPIDGNNRRSIYLSVRRNFLLPFFAAFDTPTPFSCMGKRTSSNVPAQALILLNDQFVHLEAERWAQALLTKKQSDSERIQWMYMQAFARQSDPQELQSCLQFLQSERNNKTTEIETWKKLAHVLFNVKAFIFID